MRRAPARKLGSIQRELPPDGSRSRNRTPAEPDVVAYAGLFSGEINDRVVVPLGSSRRSSATASKMASADAG